MYYSQVVSEHGFLEVRGPETEETGTHISLEWHGTTTKEALEISCDTEDCKFELNNFPELKRNIELNVG